jgi:hypothetical protein
MVEDNHKFYDKYKAGKTDPKTGVFYNDISFKKPKTAGCSGAFVTHFECFTEDCNNVMTIRRNTAGIGCSTCKKWHSISVDKYTDEVTINGVKLDEFGNQIPTTSGS